MLSCAEMVFYLVDNVLSSAKNVLSPAENKLSSPRNIYPEPKIVTCDNVSAVKFHAFIKHFSRPVGPHSTCLGKRYKF